MTTTAASAPTSTLASLEKTASTGTLAGSSSTSSALSLSSNEWLTLLTTELQNQDPTSPADPTQFVAQLAQFSSVSEQVQTNTTLGTISSQLTANSLGQAASLIGKTVQGKADSYTVPAAGSPGTSNLSYNVTNTALSNVHVQITNASGNVVAQQSVSGTTGSLKYAGTSSAGTALPAGNYTLTLVGTDGTGTSQTAGTLSASGLVQGVVQNAAGTMDLQLDNGSSIAASSVTTLTGSSA